MLIDGKHAVGIAIESRTEIGSDLQYFLLQRHQVLRLDGTGRVVGKGAIQFKVERDEMRGQVLKDTRHHHPGHAITGIDHYLERANLADVDVGKGVLDVIIGCIEMRDRTLALGLGKISAYRQVADVGKAGVQADRIGLGTAKLHAVVFFGIVRGCNHDACREIVITHNEV